MTLEACSAHPAAAAAVSTPQFVPSGAPALKSQPVSWPRAMADSPDALLVPGWLPFSFYRPSQVQEIMGPAGRAIETISEYESRDGRSVLIHQGHWPQWSVQVRGQSTAGTIGDQPATFYGYVDGNPTAVTWTLADGEGVVVITGGLTLAEMTHVAAALHN